jgi:hypothetical protein
MATLTVEARIVSLRRRFSSKVICPTGEKVFERENLSSPRRKNKSFLD